MKTVKLLKKEKCYRHCPELQIKVGKS